MIINTRALKNKILSEKVMDTTDMYSIEINFLGKRRKLTFGNKLNGFSWAEDFYGSDGLRNHFGKEVGEDYLKSLEGALKKIGNEQEIAKFLENPKSIIEIVSKEDSDSREKYKMKDTHHVVLFTGSEEKNESIEEGYSSPDVKDFNQFFDGIVEDLKNKVTKNMTQEEIKKLIVNRFTGVLSGYKKNEALINRILSKITNKIPVREETEDGEGRVLSFSEWYNIVEEKKAEKEEKDSKKEESEEKTEEKEEKDSKKEEPEEKEEKDSKKEEPEEKEEKDSKKVNESKTTISSEIKRLMRV